MVSSIARSTTVTQKIPLWLGTARTQRIESQWRVIKQYFQKDNFNNRENSTDLLYEYLWRRNVMKQKKDPFEELIMRMWPILMQFLRSNAPYITLPIAAIVGVIGYNLESLLSDKYTPYNKPVQDQRLERLSDEESLKDPTNVQKLRYKENVFGKNVSPSLEKS